MSDLPDIVIGSGPSGVSVAQARLAKGKSVLMLDAGKTLEPAHQARRDTLAATQPPDWPEQTLADYKDRQHNAPEGAIRKFGSDFAVEPREAIFSNDTNWLGLRASNAQGGLSNVWGASVMPSAQQDITDWPISADDLTPHYKAVADFMPISGRKDAVQTLYPAFDLSNHTPLPLTPQAQELLTRAEAQKNRLRDITIGAARNAASTACIECGLCLHGCPYGHIWSAAQTLETLKQHPSFTYMTGKARELTHEADHVTITPTTGGPIKAARVFVAAGVLETARLYLNSFDALTQLTLKDSQHFFTPFLHRWRAPSDPQKTPHHTLTGAFAEFQPAGSDRLVHAQLYTWNDQYKREMVAKYGKKLPFGGPIFELMSKRLIVAQSFLHSDYSGQIGLKASQDGRLIAENLPNPKTDEATQTARTHLIKALKAIGLYGLGFAGHSGSPGSSFHVGGSLPMAQSPDGATTDKLGRLKGLERIHAVDASVMTSVPASTITFTVMANAHRIGTDAP